MFDGPVAADVPAGGGDVAPLMLRCDEDVGSGNRRLLLDPLGGEGDAAVGATVALNFDVGLLPWCGRGDEGGGPGRRPGGAAGPRTRGRHAFRPPGRSALA